MTPDAGSVSPDRLAALRAAKLRAFADGPLGLGGERVAETSVRDGAMLLRRDRDEFVAVALAGTPTRRSLGPVLTWASGRAGERLDRVELLLDPAPAANVEGLAATLARIGAGFRPTVHVHTVSGNDVVTVPPEQVPPSTGRRDGIESLVAQLVSAGLEVVDEPDVVAGEVAGLEVARIHEVDGTVRLEVGVGRFDRELAAVAQADLSTAEALQRAADLVRLHRTIGAADHPLSRLARERWLRSAAIDEPGLVGFDELRPLPTLVPRSGLRIPAPAAALGRRNGEIALLVSTVGVDVDLISAAVDLRQVHAPDAPIVIAAAPSDLHPTTRRVAALAIAPVEFVTVEAPWATTGGPR